MKIPYSLPGSSRQNKTGWDRFYPAIDSARCTGCAICAQYCPDGCIEIENRKATVDLNYCKGCGICPNVCPVKAIEMKEKENTR